MKKLKALFKMKLKQVIAENHHGNITSHCREPPW